MEVIYAGEKAPESFSKSAFLAGPTPRSTEVKSWRPEMLGALERAGYDGVVFVPEPRDGMRFPNYMGQIEWEQADMNMSDIVLMWVPRQLPGMDGLTTNVEFGMLLQSGKLWYGRPHWALKIDYLDYMASKINFEPYTTIDGMAKDVAEFLKEGAFRTGGERCIPLHIWNTRHFQAWYNQQRSVGNRLDDAKVLWNYILKNGLPFCYAIWVKVWVELEQRHKQNEFIVSRTDISTICAYRKATDWQDTEILLVREFRSPVRTKDGFIHELPGGSGFNNHNPCDVAAEELEEETGIAISPKRIVEIKSRQLAGTFSTHHAVLFAVELTDSEMEQAKANAQLGKAHGNIQDSEQTYLQVNTVREILADNLVDWTTIGMIMEINYPRP